MDLKVPYGNVTNAQDAYKKACSLITPEYVAKFQVKADVSYDDKNRKMEAKGTGFKLNLEFLENECLVALDMSFLLRPLKGKILGKIERELKKYV